jgi:hypothetical protein
MNIQMDVCDEEGFLTEIDETGIWSWDFSGGNCDRTAANASYEVEYNVWGACKVNVYQDKRRSKFEFSATTSSRLYLANVNDSYVSPQTFDNQDIPIYTYDWSTCPAPDGCLTDEEQPSQDWLTRYSASGCETPEHSYSNVFEQPNVCSNYRNTSYIMTGCFDPKGSYFATFSDAACTQLVSVTAYRDDCSASNFVNHCTATITSIPMPGTHEPITSPEIDTTPVSVSPPDQQQEPGTSPASSTPSQTPSPTGSAGFLQSSLVASIVVVAILWIGF